MAGYRIMRVAEDIKRELTDILRMLKDPRISGLLTIVKVDVSKDISYAKIYISSMDGIEKAKEAVKGLTNACGFIRRELGQRIDLRCVPELKFIADDSVEYSANIYKLLDKVKSEDKSDES